MEFTRSCIPDRGQALDWLECRFIVVFLSISTMALIAAAIWEWRHPDPVVEIRLLTDRNFAIATAMWQHASINLATDYKHVALLRALQGLGIAPFFMPVSQLAYS